MSSAAGKSSFVPAMILHLPNSCSCNIPGSQEWAFENVRGLRGGRPAAFAAVDRSARLIGRLSGVPGRYRPRGRRLVVLYVGPRAAKAWLFDAPTRRGRPRASCTRWHVVL